MSKCPSCGYCPHCGRKDAAAPKPLPFTVNPFPSIQPSNPNGTATPRPYLPFYGNLC